VVHGELTASKALAEKIKENFGMKVHIPKWKECLSLKSKEIVSEEVPEGAEPEDMGKLMLEATTNLEEKLQILKKQLKNKERKAKESDMEKLTYIQEEFQKILSE
jgi:hypothetical protein